VLSDRNPRNRPCPAAGKLPEKAEKQKNRGQDRGTNTYDCDNDTHDRGKGAGFHPKRVSFGVLPTLGNNVAKAQARTPPHPDRPDGNGCAQRANDAAEMLTTARGSARANALTTPTTSAIPIMK